MKKNKFTFTLLVITIFWNIWFPKAGIKFGGIPITVGNVLFAIIFLTWMMNNIRIGKVKSLNISMILIFGIVYFILKYTIVYAIIGEIISSMTYIIPLIIYPLIFFVTVDIVDNKEKIDKVVKIIVYGFFFLCIYAILQYVVGIDKCDIPGLTVNLSDYREMGPLWFMQKSNGIDEANSKIVSTYQNGNLFGINLIFIYPLVYYYYSEKEKEKIKIFSLILFITCSFLTLSRTCWLGIVLFIFLGIIMEKEKNHKAILRKILTLFLCIICLFYVFMYIPSIANRFFDTDKSDWISMSGRTEGLITVIETVWSSNSIIAWLIGPQGIIQYAGLAYEMLPLALFAQTGIIGISLLYGFFIKAYISLDKGNYIQKSVKLSLIIWLIIGCIECGYWLPPTALNIFMILGLGFVSKNINEVK